MKNFKLKGILIASGLICVCALAGCATSNNTDQQNSALVSEPSVMSKAEKDSLTAETPGESVDYAVYEQYGLIYDEQNGWYTYNENVVRFFNDPVAGASFTNFFTGTVDIEAKRDENKELIGIEECSQETYDSHTKKYAKFANMSSSVLPSTIQYETTQNSEEWLKDYETYGIAYNKSDNSWYYNSEKIQILIDSEKAIVYSTDEDGVCLAVSRGDNHEITEIKVISLNDAQLLLQANNPGKVLDSTMEEN